MRTSAGNKFRSNRTSVEFQAIGTFLNNPDAQDQDCLAAEILQRAGKSWPSIQRCLQHSFRLRPDGTPVSRGSFKFQEADG